MSFADWKKRSKLIKTGSCVYYAPCDIERIARAAYKAGERDGRKQVEVMAHAAIALRDKLTK